jgi:hypothetical protein
VPADVTTFFIFNRFSLLHREDSSRVQVTNTGDRQFTKWYMWLIVAAGGAAVAYSAYSVPYRQLNFRFFLLLLLTVLISSRVAIKVPRVNTSITVADSFVFLTLLLYGQRLRS